MNKLYKYLKFIMAVKHPDSEAKDKAVGPDAILEDWIHKNLLPETTKVPTPSVEDLSPKIYGDEGESREQSG